MSRRAERWRLPPLEILDEAEPGLPQGQGRDQAEVIEKTLADFGLPGQVRNIHYGPRLTQFSLKPDPSTPVSGIARLAQDLAVALAGTLVEIREPGAGYPYVTLLVENYGEPEVKLRRVIGSPAFRRKDGSLKIGLGLDTFGEPVVIDLATMPHLLIGGTTGAGKSACLHAIIASLLWTCSPDQVRLLLIDPLEVELRYYTGLPHLVGPLVTRSAQALEALHQVVQEIERRYSLLATRGVRDIAAYNEAAAGRGDRLMPYGLVIIDNLFDLMLTAPRDVEQVLTRLAQKARGAGIHLVLATLRAKTDTISGAIKANFPGRIAFKVVDRSESLLILDVGGAEELLGRGDMLYKAPNTGQIQRIQGVFVSETELNRIVSFWREQVPERQRYN
jgi:S-DNA-T family DNA segregation ATPase FtsK/SpoIIIE